MDSLVLAPPGKPHSRYTGLVFSKHSRHGYILGSMAFRFCFFDHFQINSWPISRNTFCFLSNFTFLLKAFSGHFYSKSALLQFSSSFFFFLLLHIITNDILYLGILFIKLSPWTRFQKRFFVSLSHALMELLFILEEHGWSKTQKSLKLFRDVEGVGKKGRKYTKPSC